MIKPDIKTRKDVQLMVNTFYGKVRKDELLGHIFNGVIQDRWPEHLAKMYSFWQSVLFGERGYHGSPFVPHAKLPVGKEHFDRWQKLLNETLEENFQGEKADEVKWRAAQMAKMFYLKIEYYKNSGATPLS